VPASTSLQRTTEKYALQYLEDIAFDLLLARGAAAKTADLVREIQGHLPAGAALIRRTLGDSPRFLSEDRRWNLSHRALADRPLEGLLEQLLASCGRPMTTTALADEVAGLLRRTPEEMEPVVTKLLTTRRKFWQISAGTWGLTAWLLDINDDDNEEDSFNRNFFMRGAEVRPLYEQLVATSTARKAPVEAAETLIREAGHPLENKTLQLALRKGRSSGFEPQEHFRAMLDDERFMLLAGPHWALADFGATVRPLVKRLSDRAQTEAEEQGLTSLAEGPVVVKAEDIQEIREIIKREGRPLGTSELATTVFELSPTAKSFGATVADLHKQLSKATVLLKVGQQSWVLPEMMPDDIEEAPSGLVVYSLPDERLEDPEADAVLTDSGLDGDLANQVHDPVYEDFGEEADVKVKKEQMSTTDTHYSVPLHHLEAGTMKLRRQDAGFLSVDGPINAVTFVDAEQGSFPVWINTDTGLIYGLGDWYRAHVFVPGSMLHISATDTPDVYELAAEDKVDPNLAIDPERMEHLKSLREEAEKDDWSVFELLCALMSDHRKGVKFAPLWAEVNVVRRTPRRVLASDLSAYHCFYLRPAKSGNWVFDERRMDQGRKKDKKKYLRRS
jgi:DNA-directed RNA polymerase delta subunit